MARELRNAQSDFCVSSRNRIRRCYGPVAYLGNMSELRMSISRLGGRAGSGAKACFRFSLRAVRFLLRSARGLANVASPTSLHKR